MSYKLVFEFEIEHVIPQSILNNVKFRPYLNSLGLDKQSQINQVGLFSNPDVVDGLQNASSTLHEALWAGGWGINRHDHRSGHDAFQNGKKEFLEGQLNDILRTDSETGAFIYSEEARRYAILELFQWTHDLALGRITANGVVVPVQLAEDIYTELFEADRVGAQGFHEGTAPNLSQLQVELDALQSSIQGSEIIPQGSGWGPNEPMRVEAVRSTADALLEAGHITSDVHSTIIQAAEAGSPHSFIWPGSAGGVLLGTAINSSFNIIPEAIDIRAQYYASFISNLLARFMVDESGSTAAPSLEFLTEKFTEILVRLDQFKHDFSASIAALDETIVTEMGKSVNALIVGLGGHAIGDIVEFLNVSYDAIKIYATTGDAEALEAVALEYGVAAVGSMLLVTVAVVGTGAVVGAALGAPAGAVASAFVAAGFAAYGLYEAVVNGVELFDKITRDLADVIPIVHEEAHRLGDDIASNIALVREILEATYGAGFIVPDFPGAGSDMPLVTAYLVDPNQLGLPEEVTGSDNDERLYGQNNAIVDLGDGDDEIFIDGIGQAFGGAGNDLLVGGNGRIVHTGDLVDPNNPESLIAETDLVMVLDGGAGNDLIIATGAADIRGGDGRDFIFAHNTVDQPQTLALEREEMRIDAGAGDDWVVAFGAAEIRLGAGEDTLVHAGIGSIIHTGPGGENDADHLLFSQGTRVTDADGHDTLHMFSVLNARGLYLRSSLSESGFALGNFGTTRVGFNSEGDLVVGTIVHGDDDSSYMYFANGNRDPFAPTAELTAGIRVAVMDVSATPLFEISSSGAKLFGQGTVWQLLPIVFKEFVNGAYFGGTDPLVFDLDGDGLELSALATGTSTMFDMDGDGFLERTGWVHSDDGLLTLDVNGNGSIDDISELFGNGSTSGFAELADHDLNGDGVIDADDDVFSELRIWRDLDQDGVSTADELFTLNELGIASIGLAATQDGSSNALNTVARTGTFTRADGSTGTIGDIEFRIDNFNSSYAGDTTVDPAIAASMPNLTGRGTLADLHVALTLDGGNGALAQVIASVLPTLDTPDLETLRERSFAILSAWTDAPPAVTSVSPSPDVPILVSREDGVVTVHDFAMRSVVDVPLEGGGSESRVVWQLASGRPVLDGNGEVIEYPGFEDILALSSNQPGASWEALSGAEIDFLERYFGEEIPLEQLRDLSGTELDAFGEFLTIGYQVMEQLALRLAAQGGLSEFFVGLEYNVEDDSFVATTDRELVPMFEAIFAATPTDASAAQDWLSSWNTLVNAFISEYDRPGIRTANQPFLFTTIVAAYENIGLPLGLAQTAGLFGIPAEILDFGSGSRLGTVDSTIYFMGAGNDTVESGQGNDVFVFGRDFGNDVILDREAGADYFDTIRFAHLNPEDITAYRDGLDLVLDVNGGTDSIRINGQFHEQAYSLFGGQVLPSYGIEEIVFANGSVWDVGDIAREVSHPLASDDTLTGTDHIDYLDGGAGNDYLSGGDAPDFYFFDAGHGHDVIEENMELFLSGEVDALILGTGLSLDGASFERDGDSGTIRILFATGDSLEIRDQFSAAYTLIFGTQWFDRIEHIEFTNADGNREAITHGGLAQRILDHFSTDGDDQIYGFSLEDRLDGGAGNDFLSGGNENDTYVYDLGYGHDVIHEYQQFYNILSGQTDQVLFGSGVSREATTFGRVLGSDDLIISFADGGTLTIRDQFYSSPLGHHFYRIENFVFPDGVTMSAGDIQDLLLQSTAGDDTLYGFFRDDILDGGAGNDLLNGGDRNDTYVFGLGYGHDVIFDETTSVFYGDQDRLLFGAGIAPDDVIWSRPSGTDNLVGTLADGSTITIRDQFRANVLGHRYNDIEIFEFADGTILSVADIQERVLRSTDQGDHLMGFHSNDILDGGLGNDRLEGGNGGDTYVFDLGYGQDVINDNQTSVFSEAADRVAFGAGIAPEDIEVARGGPNGNNLIITIAGTTDRLTIEGHFGSRFHVIEEFVFANGTLWTAQDILERVSVITGNASNNQLTGFNQDEILTGGLGDDTLNGGQGNDAYVYNLGDGHDTIIEATRHGTQDRVLLGEGILASDVTVSRISPASNDIRLTFTDGGSILLVGQLQAAQGRGVEQVVFSDGTIWTSADLTQLAQSVEPSADDETLFGSNTVDDVLTGGLGNDVLNGRTGNDTYIYNLGDGHDTIVEAMFAGTNDRVELGAGIGVGDVRVARLGSDSDDAILYIGTSGSIILDEQFSGDPQRGIEAVHFHDGTLWTQSDLRSMVLQSTISSGDDWILGFRGNNDTLSGGLGNDVLSGLTGDDIYLYNLGDGHDEIVEDGFGGNADALLLGAGISVTDVSVRSRDFDSRHDVTLEFAGGGTVTLRGQFATAPDAGVETILFHDGTLWTRQELMEITLQQSSSQGDDTIYAFNGRDDVLHGGLGDDLLHGQSGNDTYRYDFGDGDDVIYEGLFGGDADRLVLGEGIQPQDVTLSRAADNASTVILHFAGGGSVTLHRQFSSDPESGIEFVEFDDGTVWSRADMRERLLAQGSTSAHDVLIGFGESDDVLAGGLGNDTLRGLGGNDSYVYTLGDGDDIIEERVVEGDDDRLYLGEGIAGDEVVIERSAIAPNHVTLHFSDGGSLLLQNQFSGTTEAGIENIVFDDGTVWTAATLRARYLEGAGTSGHDTVIGFESDDDIVGGLGNDTLRGLDGNDSYQYSLGDGDDVIVENGFHGSEDRLVFDEGISVADISFVRNDAHIDDVTLQIAGGGSVRLDEQFSALTWSGIEFIEFSDGTVWNRETLRDLILQQASTNGNDVINGFDDNGDTLIGGRGDDLLNGQNGSDTYVYNLGDGSDTIVEASFDGAVDRLLLGEGILATDVILMKTSAESTSLTLVFVDGGSVTLADQFGTGSESGVEEIVFEDGTVWTRAMLANMPVEINRAPTLAATPQTQQLQETAGWSYVLPVSLFEDADGDSLVLTARLADGSALPDWITFEAETGRFTGTPPVGASGALAIRVGAFDGLVASSVAFDLVISSVPTPLADWTGTSADENYWLQASEFVADGGQGDDDLVGNDGDSVFLWRKGDGNDLFGERGGFDEVHLLDVNADDVVFGISPDWESHITVTIVSTGEVITLTDQLPDPGTSRIEQIRFADGSIIGF
ncbi:calcium-binding protein, partial [Stappia sp. MMSF_3263]|uniref:calcium-binding protein n=1 Tax=Stappia sp. MMSF_3263 TaxID=3046693 RepID=UPI00273CFB5A